MPSRQIPTTQAPAPAPYTVQITAPDGLTPEAVFASWDGTGAGGAFLPCVSYYNAQGVLLDRAFPDGLTLHPGDTAEVSYRPFRRGGGGGGASVTFENGVIAVPDVTDVFVDGNMSLNNLGAGQVSISAIGGGPATQPSLLLAFYNVPSPQVGLSPGSFPVHISVSNGNRPGVTGGRALFQFNGGRYRMVVRGEVWNGTASTIDARLDVVPSIGPGIPELPAATTALAVPPGGTGTVPPIYLDINPNGLAVAWLDYGTTITGTGVSITGVQLIGDIEFRPT